MAQKETDRQRALRNRVRARRRLERERSEGIERAADRAEGNNRPGRN